MVHVLLITNDAALQQRITAAKPTGVSLQILSHEAFQAAGDERAEQCWFDLRGADLTFAPVAPTLVLLAPTTMVPPAHWPSHPFVRLPITDSDLAILWGTAETAEPDQSEKFVSLRALPEWVLDYLALDLRELCHELAHTLPKQLGFAEAILFLADSEPGASVISESSISDVVQAAHHSARELAQFEAFIQGLVKGKRDPSGMLLLDDGANWTTAMNESEAIFPLLTCRGPVGAVKLFEKNPGHRACSQSSLPLISKFLGTALQQARRLAKESNEARIDCLTGLCNVRSFRETLQSEIHRATRFHTPLSLIALDLDSLKEINDRYGHPCGDDVLRHAAASMSAQLRGFDIAARVGGDEFMILLPATDRAGAEQVATRIIRELRETPLSFNNVVIHVGLSAGIAQYKRSWSAEALRQAADDALYAAKPASRERDRGTSDDAVVRFEDEKAGTEPENQARNKPTIVPAAADAEVK